MGEREVAAEVGAVEESAGEHKEQVHVGRAFRGKFSAFEKDGGAGNVGLGVAARAAGPIDDDWAARGKEDVVGMEIGMANGGAMWKEREGSFGSTALCPGDGVGASEPVFELLALGREFGRGGELMDLCVEMGKEARRVEQFPGLPLDELEEGGTFDAFENNSGAAIEVDQLEGGRYWTTSGVQDASDLKFEFGFRAREACEEKFEDAAGFPREDLGGEALAKNLSEVRRGDVHD